MTRTWVSALSILSIMAGGSLLFYLVTTVPPSTGDDQLDIPAIVLFFMAVLLTVCGLAALTALRLHRRWPALAGVHGRGKPNPVAALRQGALVALAVVLLGLLALLRMFDMAFIAVALVLLWLVEAFVQSRQ